MNFYQYTEEADLIIEDAANGLTYVCTMRPSLIDHTQPHEQQNCWQIKRIHETTANGISRTEIMYPNGTKDFRFAPDDINSYTFDYRK